MSQRDGSSRYFVAVAVLLLATVAIGFARTFFARALFDVPPIPWHYYVHAVLLSCWFVLLVLQTALIAARSAALHRRVGVFGVFVALGVVASGVIMVVGLPARVRAGLTSGEAPFDEGIARFIVWTDLAALAIFATYVAVALLFRRRRPDVHKRLMLLASMVIVGPAAARLGLLLAEHSTVPSWAQTMIQVFLFVGLPVTLAVHDRIATKRFHGATIVGVLGLLASTLVGIAIASTPAGAAFVETLATSGR